MPHGRRRQYGFHRSLSTLVCIIGAAIVGAGCGSLQLPEPAEDAGEPPAPAGPRPSGTEAPAPTRPAPLPPAAPVAPRKIALLLPLSGPQQVLAEAIRDGFIAAYLADNHSGRKPDVLILDEEDPGPADSYRNAVSAGADLIVGPLLKESVAQVAGIAGSVPTLTLNYLDAGPNTGTGPAPVSPGRFYQFSLAPEDEAREVAERAASQGQLRAIALAPDTEWGRRMLTAFMPALESFGGAVVAYRFYDPQATDFTAQIQRLLLLDESESRHRKLEANLGVSLEYEPRRRGDVDFIFLAANAAAGRLIRPQLRFLYAGDIPTYATSAIYLAGSSGDRDLDGVRFTDAPVLLAPDAQAQSMTAALQAYWPPGATSRLRFYAMGYDAYGLAGTAAMPGGINGFSGLSGMLSMDGAGRIHRRMPWAEFHDGGIMLLPYAPPPMP